MPTKSLKILGVKFDPPVKHPVTPMSISNLEYKASISQMVITALSMMFGGFSIRINFKDLVNITNELPFLAKGYILI